MRGEEYMSKLEGKIALITGVLLASDDVSHVNGAELFVDGGAAQVYLAGISERLCNESITDREKQGACP
jgi:hypothetical protein